MNDKSWYSIEQGKATAEVFIYNEIGMYGISANDFANELKELGNVDLTVRINSPGGSVYDGIAIYNAIKRHRGTVTTHIDALAASMASIIALAGDSVVMGENSFFMIHNPWGIYAGDASEIQRKAAMLNKIQEQMISIYVGHSNLTAEQVREAMELETWYTAQEALAVEFVTEIDTGDEFEAMAFDLNVFKNPPEFQAQASAITPDIKSWITDNTLSLGTPQGVAVSVPENNEVQMKKDKQTAAPAVDEKAVAQAERQRVTGIMAKAKQFDIPEDKANELIESNFSIDEASAKILDFLAEKQTEEASIAPQVKISSDNRDIRIEAMSNAVLHRAGVEGVELHESARQFRSMDLMELARSCVGDARHMSRIDIAHAALTSSDFTAVLSNVANKSLQAGYEAHPRTFTAWAQETTATDFKAKHSIQIGREFDLEEVPENGEYKHGSLAETVENYKLKTFGKIISITRQTIINDDLDALARIPVIFGEAAAELESKQVYNLLNSNPTMSNNKALFSSDHKNLGTLALSLDALGEGREKLRTLKAVGGKQRVSITPKILLIPAALETTADQLTTAITPNSSGDVNPFGPGGRTTVTPVVESLLDDKSKTAWYMFGDKNRSPIEYSYLDGNRTPTITQQQGFDVDGVKMKVSHDFGVGATNTAAYKSTGAAQ